MYIKGRSKPILRRVRIPKGFYHKAKGLLGEKRLEKDTGMLFTNCNSIHMMGMRYSLDLVFMSKEGFVLKCQENIPPWRIAWCLKSFMTLELAAGSIKNNGIKTGMKLEIIECM